MNFRKQLVNVDALARDIEGPLAYAQPEVRRVVEGPIPNSKDRVVESFLEMGENIAKDLEKMGDMCEEQGKIRKQEYYKAASISRKKAEFQAREAGLLIDDFLKLQALSRNGSSQSSLSVADQATEHPRSETPASAE